MEDPLGVSPIKGNQGTTRGKEKLLLTSVGSIVHCLTGMEPLRNVCTTSWLPVKKKPEKAVINTFTRVELETEVWIFSLKFIKV